MVKFAGNNLASLDGNENGIYPIYSSNPNSETAWSKALSAAEVSSDNDLSHTIFFTSKTFPIGERYPNFADFTDVRGLLAGVRVESMDRDINKSILKITEAICETGTTEVALRDTDRAQGPRRLSRHGQEAERHLDIGPCHHETMDDEGNDPRRVILIMPYRSWARKTLMTKEENDKVTYSSSFASQSRGFEVLICDEAHRLKERSTVSFKAVSLIAASRVLLTTTPCLNDPKDYLALAEIIWTCRHQILDQEERDFLLELEKKGYGQFANTVKSFCQDENTHRTLRSLASKPEIVKALIHNSTEKQSWEAGFHHFSSVAILRRSASSAIFRMKGKEHPVSLTSVLPQLRPSSVSIDFETELKSKIEYSMLHLYTEVTFD
ncbi:uncharacterized protein CCOS01_03127 [Colletotrichum costaricense]|uniref:SNF2 N-terminal domain-containing protein n=1 Tax=Colletotrichum costaricense TaxID=1209916 RepID=A0AAI9Z613_9PEZI|nr:uncharacterized protein CCOS01_03127 [Colletotrichum costaricense]KAK1534375.1 hypothetical protein CCOS01_03127 [Colletotrichum costaricense]